MGTKKWILFGIQFILLVTYSVMALLENQEFSNFLSPLLLMLAGIGILLTSYNRKETRIYWRLLAFGILFWSFTDFIWFTEYNLLGGAPEENNIYGYLYAVTNILFAYSCCLFFYKNINKWHFVQLITDTGLVMLVLFLTVKSSLFGLIEVSNLNIHEWITTFINLFTDIIILSVLVAMAISKHEHRFNGAVRMLFIGLMLFPLADLLYAYMIYYDIYIANNITDVMFMWSLSLVAYSAAYLMSMGTESFEESYLEDDLHSKEGVRFKWLILLPLSFYIFGHIDFTTIIEVTALLGLHHFVSLYFKKVKEVEELLSQEKEYSELLDKKVKERTLELEKSNETLNYLVNMDSLCDLPNRRSFIEKIEKLSKSNSGFALYYLDLDRFKLINDIHGHEMGDRVLIELSRNLRFWRPENVFVSRIGGDEFGLIYEYEGSREDNVKIAREIMNIFKMPIEIDAFKFSLGASIGISKFPDDSRDRIQLMKYADIAMLQAKKISSGERIVFYKSHLSERIERTNHVELLLKNANFDDEFKLVYQPQIDVKSERVIGAEALLRWNSPVIGNVSPGEFIPIAEQSELILDIGKWVIEKSMLQLKKWNNEYDKNFKMGINISPIQFDSIDFFSYIVLKINEIGVLSSNIDFEITENSAMNSGVVMEEIFTSLSGLGVQISIDDFGTGYSSLSYIKRFDIDRLKIAKELIDNIAIDHVDRLIIKAIIMMAKGMGLATIAEGVETIQQLEYLRAEGCDEVQGYYYCKPISSDDFEGTYFKQA